MTDLVQLEAAAVVKHRGNAVVLTALDARSRRSVQFTLPKSIVVFRSANREIWIQRERAIYLRVVYL